MNGIKAVLSGGLALLVAMTALAAPEVRTTTSAADPVVREIEAVYVKFASAARKGDLKTFKSLRTAEANQGIPANASAGDLKGMAAMMAPALAGYRFARLDTTANEARVVYLRETKSELNVLVMMFEREGGGWKVGGNHGQDYVGQPPSTADAVAEALNSPGVRFRE